MVTIIGFIALILINITVTYNAKKLLHINNYALSLFSSLVTTMIIIIISLIGADDSKDILPIFVTNLFLMIIYYPFNLLFIKYLDKK